MGKRVKLFIISAYLPCTSYDNTDYEILLAALEHMIANRPKGSIALVGSDVNAALGNSLSTGPECTHKALGPYGNPRTNDRGRILHKFLHDNQLCAASTFYNKKG